MNDDIYSKIYSIFRERRQRSESRGQLLQEQDAAYQASLQADREKVSRMIWSNIDSFSIFQQAEQREREENQRRLVEQEEERKRQVKQNFFLSKNEYWKKNENYSRLLLIFVMIYVKSCQTNRLRPNRTPFKFRYDYQKMSQSVVDLIVTTQRNYCSNLRGHRKMFPIDLFFCGVILDNGFDTKMLAIKRLVNWWMPIKRRVFWRKSMNKE